MITATTQSKTSRVGWGILLVISALLILNGAGWFFRGPDMSLSYVERTTGMPVEAFREAYPTVADTMAANARQVAIWFMGFGLLALLVVLEGFRRGSRWAWSAAWVLPVASAAVGANELVGRGSAFGASIVAVAATAMLGLLLARRGLVP